MSVRAIDLVPLGRGAAQWPLWSTTARIVVTDPSVLPEAIGLVEEFLDAVDAACSRFRDDSQTRAVADARGRPVRVSPLLARYVAAGLQAARRTDGDVDPTLGASLAALGYDRDIAAVDGRGAVVPLKVRRRHTWRSVRLDGDLLTVPDGLELDLGATAKALAADETAALVAQHLRTGVLVDLGGDLATAGPAPGHGWSVQVQDRVGDPACVVAVPAGGALATSSTVSRRWRVGEHSVHHLLDPHSGRPASEIWRSVSVAAWSCLEANTLSTAAIVRGSRAPHWLRTLGATARLVDASGHVVARVGGWPADTAA